MGTVIRGPWMHTPLPPSWFASVNGGASAFSVLADTREQALTAAIDRLYIEAMSGADPSDPFALDSAEGAFRVLLGELRIYSGPEWTEHVMAEAQASIKARWPNWTPQGVA